MNNFRAAVVGFGYLGCFGSDVTCLRRLVSAEAALGDARADAAL